MSCITSVSDFVTKKRKNLEKDNSSIDILAQNSSADVVPGAANDKASSSFLDRIAGSPVTQLGQDFLSEQIAKNGSQIINNTLGAVEETVDKVVGVSVRKVIADAQTLVFNSIALAVTAQNDLALFFLQQVAKNAVTAIQKKREIALVLQEKLKHLYNALVILVNGQPFFDKYLVRLRQAILNLVEAQKKFTTVRSTFISTDNFLKNQFDQGKAFLELAETNLTPENHNPADKFNVGTLLENVGIPKEPQQLTVMLSIPKLVKDVLAASNGYFLATLKVNALLLAFIQGLEKFQTSSSKMLKNYTVSLLDSILTRLGSLIGRMANDVNGGPTQTAVPLASFRPDSVKVSATALSWMLEVKALIEYVNFVPGQALSSINLSNSVVTKYNQTVAALQTKDSRNEAGAVLTAQDGREEVGQLEAQLTTFCLASLKAIIDATVASSILSLGRVLQKRIDLTLTQDTEIEIILQAFINTPIPGIATLKKIGDSIFGLMSDFGLDRAADLLQKGSFEEFFNLNTKTATFAGAALLGIATLKECLSTSEDRAQLAEVETEIKRETKAKELLTQRSAVTGFEQRRAQNKIEDRRLASIDEKAQEACGKCGLPSDFSGSNLLATLGGVVGVTAFGNNDLSKELSKLGRGIL